MRTPRARPRLAGVCYCIEDDCPRQHAPLPGGIPGHLARTPVGDNRLLRMRWASGQYHNQHPEVSALGAYKDLEGLLA